MLGLGPKGLLRKLKDAPIYHEADFPLSTTAHQGNEYTAPEDSDCDPHDDIHINHHDLHACTTPYLSHHAAHVVIYERVCVVAPPCREAVFIGE